MKKIKMDKQGKRLTSMMKQLNADIVANLSEVVGGLSIGIFFTAPMQEYLNEHYPHLFGYVGSPSRREEFDRIIEKELRKFQLDDEGVGIWIASKAGRWLMDSVEGTEPVTACEFKEAVKTFFSKYSPAKWVQECREEMQSE